jgi:hypothetical protein
MIRLQLNLKRREDADQNLEFFDLATRLLSITTFFQGLGGLQRQALFDFKREKHLHKSWANQSTQQRGFADGSDGMIAGRGLERCKRIEVLARDGILPNKSSGTGSCCEFGVASRTHGGVHQIQRGAFYCKPVSGVFVFVYPALLGAENKRMTRVRLHKPSTHPFNCSPLFSVYWTRSVRPFLTMGLLPNISISYGLIFQTIGLYFSYILFKFAYRLYQVRSTVRNVAKKHGIVSAFSKFPFDRNRPRKRG